MPGRIASWMIVLLLLLACGSETKPGGGKGGPDGPGGTGGSAGAGGTGGEGGAGGSGGGDEGAALSLPDYDDRPIAVPLHGHVEVRIEVDRARAGDGPLRIELVGELPAGVRAGVSAEGGSEPFESLELEVGKDAATIHFHSGEGVEALDAPVGILLRGSGGEWEEELEVEIQVSALVTNQNDAGPGSLRDLIERAPQIQARPRIGFAPWAFPPTPSVYRIALEDTLLITESMDIEGPHDEGRPLVVLEGGEAIRPIMVGSREMVTSGATMELGLAHLRIEKGKALGDGGCILAHLDLELDEVVFSECVAEDAGTGLDSRGGAIFAGGRSHLRISGSRFLKNRAMSGGAVAVGGKAKFEATAFVDNHADRFGGALQLWTEEEQEIIDCLFERNEAELGGAIVFVDGPLLRIDETRFIGNAAVRGDYGGGGAIFNEVGQTDTIHISNSLFQHNSGKPFGGAIMSDRGHLLVETSRFIENEAHAVILGSASVGGAIHSWTDGGDNLSIFDSLFLRNKADTAGAIHADGNLWMEGVSVIENVAEGWAGGIDLVHAERAHIENTTIANNRAEVVGGIHVHAESTLRMIHVTITGNRATGGGDGADRMGPVGGLALANAELALGRSIVAGNEATGDTTRDIWIEPSLVEVAHFVSRGFNLVGDTHGSAKLLAPSILLNGALGDLWGNKTGPGGVLETRLEEVKEVGPRAWVAIPMEGSPAVDRIPLDDCEDSPATDQRGAARPRGDGCDSGAAER